jgi:hypothetical protein
MKECTSCGVPKPASDFYDDGRPGSTRKRPRCKACHNRAASAWRSRNRDKSNSYTRRSNLRRKLRAFDLDPEDYSRMVAEANGRCSICGGAQVGNKGVLSLDHDHATGRVRGLLCDPCNLVLGVFGDDPERFEAAARYLLTHATQEEIATRSMTHGPIVSFRT